MEPIHIFVSFSREDEAHKAILLKHLRALNYDAKFEIWDESRISPGHDWKANIEEALSRADIALVLVSPDYLASSWTYEYELPRLLEMSSRGDVTVVPIIVRPCDWFSSPLARYQALPRTGKPVSQLEDPDDAWLNIAHEIRRLVRSLRDDGPQPPRRRSAAQASTRHEEPIDDVPPILATLSAESPRAAELVAKSLQQSPMDGVSGARADTEVSPELSPIQEASTTKATQAKTEPSGADASPQQVSTAVAKPAGGPASSEDVGAAPDHADGRLEVRQYAVADRPAPVDHLGFAPSVRALAAFLTAEATQPPLTVSIEGEWGSGKSSFMLQLRQRLDAGGATTVSFNAWKHDKEDELWAAFALNLVRQLATKRSFFRRFVCNALLQWKRLKARKSVLSALSLATTLLLLMLVPLVLLGLPFKTAPLLIELLSSKDTPEATKALEALFGSSYQRLSSLGRWAVVGSQFVGAFFALRVFWLRFSKVLENPLEVDLTKYIEDPRYEDRLSFLQRLHSDLGLVLDAYTGKSPVFVFIDDLDRCETPKSAELMQGLNLMTEADSRLIFILGMDRDKIASAFAAKHEDIVKYLPSSSKGRDEDDAVRGLEYGHSFIEKFVQVPFRIPRPRAVDIAQFITAVTGAGALGASPAAPVSEKSTSSTAPLGSGPLRPTVSSAAPGDGPAPRLPPARVDAPVVDTPLVSEMLQIVAPAMDYNPRRLKQFLNLFRLSLYIGREIDLFSSGPAAGRTITPEQLGKFVALSIRWPLLVMELQQDSTLLQRLHATAASPPVAGAEISPDLVRWVYRPRLMDLIRAGCLVSDVSKDSILLERYSMGNFDVVRFLRAVSLPEAPRPQRAASAPSIAP